MASRHSLDDVAQIEFLIDAIRPNSQSHLAKSAFSFSRQFVELGNEPICKWHVVALALES
jgi:hypothetical protein